jgi:hypothetical protein
VTRPVNALASPRFKLDEIFAAGAQRVSVGARLTWVAVEAFATAAKKLREGDLSVLAARVELDEWFAG